MQRLLHAACKDRAPEGGHTHIFFMDKNHPPSALKRVCEDIDRVAKVQRDVIVRKLYLVPQRPSKANSYLTEYPSFSEKYIAQVFAWAQSRTDHETLDNSNPVNTLEVQTMFLRLNQRANFNQQFVNKSGIDGLLEIPLGNESIELPESLSNAVYN